jgi:hypothetical protein
MLDVEKEMRKAVHHFRATRSTQKTRQGLASGQRDAGDRAAVTGGKHADGFIELIARIVRDSGLPDAAIRASEKAGCTLPGYFRPTKEWDVVVVWKDSLIATVEVKSQVGSFGNNFNNRVEEAVGSATDFWKAYEYGRFQPSGRPWLGYLFMLEESPDSIGPKKPTKLEPFEVDSEFQTRSYAGRYELVCQRLLRERLYDAACFFTSNAAGGARGEFREPNPELGIRPFAVSLSARARAFAELG